MRIQEVKIGTRIELELINSLGEKTSQTYVSQLIDIVNSEDIIISCPIFESKFVFIAMGSNIRILFMHEKYGLMSFTAAITGKEKKGNIMLLYIKLSSKMEKIQRRKYYRLDCNLDSLYRVLPEESDSQAGKPDQELPEFKKAISKNLSGSGACIVTEESVAKGSHVDVKIFISDNNPIKALCVVMRSSPINTSKEKKHELGLYFKQISPRDQDVVIKYIFDQQRLLLKKNT